MAENTEILRQPMFKTPMYMGDFDPERQGGYNVMNQVSLFGCVWESKNDNNTTAPAVWDGGDTITPNTQDWKQVSGDYEAWLMNKDKPATTGTTGAYPYNGMGRVVLKKNIVDGVNTLTHEAFEDSEGNDRENTIYVIQYDFTLTGNVTIPANCVLEFDGGSISGAYTLTANNTSINTPLKKIFDDNITLRGNWDIEHWEADWFGMVNDGTMTFGAGQAAAFNGTDNWNALQHALYTASITNISIVHLSNGKYRLSKPIFIGYNEYNNISLKGNGNVKDAELYYNKGTALLFDNEIGGIFVNSSRHSKISDLAIYGKNTRYHTYNPATLTSDEQDWFYTTISKHNGVDYVGIMIDCIVGNSNYTPFATDYNMDTQITNYGGHVKIENVSIKGFYSGVDLQTNTTANGNCDFIKLIEVYINWCVYGLRNSAEQGRKLNVTNCYFNNCHTAVDNHSGGNTGNMEGIFLNTQFEAVFQIFNLSGQGMTLISCGGELIYRLGIYAAQNISLITFIQGDYSFYQLENNPIGLLPLIDGKGISTEYAYCFGTHFWGGGAPVVLDGVTQIGDKVNPVNYNLINCRCKFDLKNIIPEFFIDAGGDSTHTTVIDGTKIIISCQYPCPNIAVGDLISTQFYGDVFEVTNISGNVFTLQAKTLIRNGAFRTDALPGTNRVFNPASRLNWWKVSCHPNAATTFIPDMGYTANRPNRNNITKGFQYYDTNLNKPIWWDGTQWVDATGTSV